MTASRSILTALALFAAMACARGGPAPDLVRFTGGQLTPLQAFPSSWQHARLLLRGTDPQRSWLVMQLTHNTDRPSGQIFVHEDGKLSRFMPELETADMDAHLGRGLIALSVWSGSERHVRVRRL